MNIGRSSFILVVCLLLFSCGGAKRTPRSYSLQFPPGYKGPDMVTYAYLEGVKQTEVLGDNQRALMWLNSAINIDPGHAPSYYDIANILATGKPDVALQYSEKAYLLDSTNIWYESQLGRLLLVKQDYIYATKIYENLVRKEPQDAENYRILAALYQQNGQPFSAIMVLDSAEMKVGRIEELATYKQHLLVATKQYKRAILEAETLIETFPYNAENYLSLAEVYARTGRDSSALANYRKALAIDSTNVDILISLNDFYKDRDDVGAFLSTTKKIFLSKDVALENKLLFLDDLKANPDFYRANFEQISDLTTTLAIMYPDSYKALGAYASSLLGYGSVEEALKLYKEYIARESAPPMEAFENVIDIEAYLKRADSVYKYTDLALKYFPDNSDLYVRKGATLAHLEDFDGAERAYDSAIKYAGSDSTRGVILGVTGDMWHQRGDNNKAYAYYKRSLKEYPDNSMVLNNYAYFLAEENRQLQDALKMSGRAIKLNENNPTYLDTYAWVLYRMGNYAEAKKAMQQAISLDRNNSPELAFHYGDILYALKDYFMASVYWNKALERGYDKEIIQSRLKLVEGK